MQLVVSVPGEAPVSLTSNKKGPQHQRGFGAYQVDSESAQADSSTPFASVVGADSCGLVRVCLNQVEGEANSFLSHL